MRTRTDTTRDGDASEASKPKKNKNKNKNKHNNRKKKKKHENPDLATITESLPSAGAILTDAVGTEEWQVTTVDDSLIARHDGGPAPTESETMISVSTTETIQARSPLGEVPQRGPEQASLSLVNGTTPLEEGQTLVYTREGETVQPNLVTEAVALASSPKQTTDLGLHSEITTQDLELHNPSGWPDSKSEAVLTRGKGTSGEPDIIDVDSQETGWSNGCRDSVGDRTIVVETADQDGKAIPADMQGKIIDNGQQIASSNTSPPSHSA